MLSNGGEALLPRALCQLSVQPLDGTWLVNYLTERDHAWLEALIGEYCRYRGACCSELKQRLVEPLPVRAPRSKRRIVEHVLDRLSRGPQVSALPPREARQVLFSLSAHQSRQRSAVLGEAAAALKLSADALDAALFADLESERRVGELAPELTPAALAEHTNLTIVESLLGRARELRITLPQHSSALVRHARGRGLLCVVEPLPAGRVRLYVSGPYALFRQTRVYGRALTSLVRRTLGAHDYEISADCQLSARGDPIVLGVRAGAPVGLVSEPPYSESLGERAFARDFQRLTREWELVRDPEPVPAGCQLVFADFELRHRAQAGQRWLVEIVGYWTRDYLVEKLARLRAAGLDRVLLCVDARRSCGAGDLPDSSQLVAFRRKVDAQVVLARLEAG